jgi:hypothetical protein
MELGPVTISKPNWAWALPMFGMSAFLLLAVAVLVSKGVVEALLLALAVLILLVLPTLWMVLFQCSSVSFTEGRSLVLSSVVRSSKEVRFTEIIGFSRLFLLNSSRPNLVLYLSNDDHIHLTSFLLKNVAGVESTLREHGVACLGDETSPFFPLPKLKYSFDPK